MNVWYHVGSAREKPGPHRASLISSSTSCSKDRRTCRKGLSTSWLEGGRRQQQRLHHQTDRTNYYIDVPSNALELALFLESDRMGYLLDIDEVPNASTGSATS